MRSSTLLLIFSLSLAASQEAYNNIRNTLARYAIAIDEKKFSDLSFVFTPNAIANYSAPLNVLFGLSAIEAVLQASLLVVSTQHLLGTQLINIYKNETADSVTYLTASHFGAGVYVGAAYYTYGKYADHLVRTREGWRVDRRHLIYMGPGIGNISIFSNTMPAPGSIMS